MRFIKIFFITHCFIISLFASRDIDRDAFGKTFFNPRSQGSNSARDITNIPQFLIDYDNTCFHGIIAVTPEVSSSYDRDAIGKFFFFNRTSTMKIGAAEGPGVDIFAENFLLNDDFNSSITAKPRATNVLIDFATWLIFDNFCNGLYFFIHAPFVWTKWHVTLDETILSPGTFILANHLGNLVNTPAPANSMETAWKGQTTFANVQQPMRFARIDGSQKKVGLADVEMALGYAFINEECSYLSVNLRAIAPTGTRPTGEFVFEPIIGNTRHWEIGFGILGNLELWNNGCNQTLSIVGNGALYTMFSSRQKRTFDLKRNGVGSRYLLLKRFNPDGSYAGEIVRGPNVLTLDVSTHNNIHGDATIMLDFLTCNWNFEVGYNLWGRTKDKITLKGTIPDRTFGVAGLSGTAGGANDTASQTLINGENATSIDPNPVFISTADIDIESAEHPGCFSHAVFAYGGYTWNCIFQPFLGLGIQAEFSGSGNRAFRMVHGWLKGGISF